MILAHQVLPGDLAGAWTFDPAVLASLALAGLVYGLGTARFRRRGATPHRTRRAVSFYAGLAVLFAALVSPLDALSSATFAAHMVQHLMLMIVAAPLLVAAHPAATLALGLPSTPQRLVARTSRKLHRVTGWLRHPVVVGVAGVLVLWAWHMPSLYEAALSHDAVHAVEHASFLGSALLFWSVVQASGRRRGAPRPVAVFLVFVTAVQSTALGAILVFASTVLYPIQTAGATAWGLTPIDDQRLAGALMWVPPAMVYLVVMAVLLVRWFSEMPPASSPGAGHMPAEPVLTAAGREAR